MMTNSYVQKIRVAALLGLGLFLLEYNLPAQNPVTVPTAKARVTVADSITMSRISGYFNGSPYSQTGHQYEFVSYSPRHTHFAAIVYQGNLKTNAVEYSILLFRADLGSSRTLHPKTLVTFSSSSNREGISHLEWLDDEDTIFFLGARNDGVRQVYSVRCSSGVVKQITSHNTSVTSYAVSKAGHEVVYAAEKPAQLIVSPKVIREGLHVQDEAITELLAGRIQRDQGLDLFAKNTVTGRATRLRTLGQFGIYQSDLSLSPDGRYLVVTTETITAPQKWERYKDVAIGKPQRRDRVRYWQFELIDTDMGSVRPLLDAPAEFSTANILWNPKSRSLIVGKTYLPFGLVDSHEAEERRNKTFASEITVPEGIATKISRQDISPVYWHSADQTVAFQVRENRIQANSTPDFVFFQKTGDTWTRSLANHSYMQRGTQVRVEQNINLPPRLVASDEGGDKLAIFDLNPGFHRLSLGRVEHVSWRDELGDEVKGGLYFPPDYKEGRKYPLVIQTHGFNEHAFSLDGYYTTAFAAQPLAANGIIVLQINDTFSDFQETPAEAEHAMAAYESAVKRLAQKGIVDSDRVGIVGFSRTCWYVKYALTHSQFHFAAAVVSDGVDAGYLQYILFSNIRGHADAAANLIGGKPFGDEFQLWLKRSPGFLLERINTPIQIQALNPVSLLAEWQWFAGLRLLDKPVDLLYLPKATHVLVKPWERLASQQGVVDWFRFWLKQEQDSDPQKINQYRNWRGLLQLQKDDPNAQTTRDVSN